jgi:hypothetical protein
MPSPKQLAARTVPPDHGIRPNDDSASRHSKHLVRMAKVIRVAAWFGIGEMPAIR